ncbi:MAG: cytochrome b N-terminal domain-containing protein [Firmicutes bacterium]|nr:cytochrome b N-terminal domain-containing protein [Bacillota bacterium]
MSMLQRAWRWVDERLHIEDDVNEAMYHPIPRGESYADFLGFAAVFVFINQFITGILLASSYAPSTALQDGLPYAYWSVKHIMSTPWGHYLRSLHYWGASFMVVVVFLHMLRVFYIGAYKKPREIIWMIGTLLFVTVLAFAFTGYLLPWDQEAYWATMVGTAMAGYTPWIGDWITGILRGGLFLSGATVSRFFAIHVLVLPITLILLLLLHIGLVFKLGVTEAEKKLPKDYHQRHVKGRRDIPPGMVPFFPYGVFGMTMTVALTALILFVVAYFYMPGLTDPADPLNREGYEPKPPWYFMFLYQFLKFVPGYYWADVFAIIVVPALAIAALFFLPLYDKNPYRSPARRPVGLATMASVVVVIVGLTYIGMSSTVKPPTSTEVKTNATWSDVSAIFANYCATCHIASNSGGLSLASYESTMKGGDAGPVIVPGKPEESLLWLVINGKPNKANIPPMPLGQQPIPANAIKTIENWIKNGAPK